MIKPLGSALSVCFDDKDYLKQESPFVNFLLSIMSYTVKLLTKKTFLNQLILCISYFQTYKFPLSIVVCHLVFKFLVSLVCRKIYELRTHQKRVLLCWHNQLHKIAPTGIASGLDIGFSQWGLQLNAVSL